MLLTFLYETIPGRFLLKFLTWPRLSVLAGRFLDSGYSRFLIPIFVKKNKIDLSICRKQEFDSFNDCFCRELKEGERMITDQTEVFLSPCDGLLSVYPIKDDLVIPVKQSQYTVSSLLRSKELARRYKDGYCFVFRLCVHHYHRYGFTADGYIDKRMSSGRKIRGVLHTVRPIALKNRPVFTENCREYTLIHTDEFGDVIQMEVGAMLVGKILNFSLSPLQRVRRGEEKGHFLYGGSTIIVLTQKDQVQCYEKFLVASENGLETEVKYGEGIGTN